MERARYPYKPPRTPTGRPIAWLALLFSLLAFLMSGAALLLTWHDGDWSGRAQSLFQGLHAPPAPGASGAGAEPSRPSDFAAQWDKLRDKLSRAEVLIGSHDGQARQYLDGLRADLDQLRKGSSEKGAAWINEAAEKLKTIREQAAVNGPEAIRRLRQLSTDIQQQARNLQRAGDVLRGLTPGGTALPAEQGAATPPAPAGGGARNP